MSDRESRSKSKSRSKEKRKRDRFWHRSKRHRKSSESRSKSRSRSSYHKFRPKSHHVPSPLYPHSQIILTFHRKYSHHDDRSYRKRYRTSEEVNYFIITSFREENQKSEERKQDWQKLECLAYLKRIKMKK